MTIETCSFCGVQSDELGLLTDELGTMTWFCEPCVDVGILCYSDGTEETLRECLEASEFIRFS